MLMFMPYDVFCKYTKHFQLVTDCVHSVFYVLPLFLLVGI